MTSSVYSIGEEYTGDAIYLGERLEGRLDQRIRMAKGAGAGTRGVDQQARNNRLHAALTGQLFCQPGRNRDGTAKILDDDAVGANRDQSPCLQGCLQRKLSTELLHGQLVAWDSGAEEGEEVLHPLGELLLLPHNLLDRRAQIGLCGLHFSKLGIERAQTAALLGNLGLHPPCLLGVDAPCCLVAGPERVSLPHKLDTQLVDMQVINGLLSTCAIFAFLFIKKSPCKQPIPGASRMQSVPTSAPSALAAHAATHTIRDGRRDGPST